MKEEHNGDGSVKDRGVEWRLPGGADSLSWKEMAEKRVLQAETSKDKGGDWLSAFQVLGTAAEHAW